LNKLLDSALSGLQALRLAIGLRCGDRRPGPELERVRRGQRPRSELAETDTLGRPWGFEDNKDDGATERRGEEEEEGAALKEKEKK